MKLINLSKPIVLYFYAMVFLAPSPWLMQRATATDPLKMGPSLDGAISVELLPLDVRSQLVQFKVLHAFAFGASSKDTTLSRDDDEMVFGVIILSTAVEHGLTQDLTFLVVPQTEGYLFEPWKLVLLQNQRTLALTFPLRPVKSLAPWRGGKRVKPKPVELDKLKAMKLQFLEVR